MLNITTLKLSIKALGGKHNSIKSFKLNMILLLLNVAAKQTRYFSSCDYAVLTQVTHYTFQARERSGSVVECLIRDWGPWVRAPSASMRCVPEQDTLILA